MFSKHLHKLFQFLVISTFAMKQLKLFRFIFEDCDSIFFILFWVAITNWDWSCAQLASNFCLYIIRNVSKVLTFFYYSSYIFYFIVYISPLIVKLSPSLLIYIVMSDLQLARNGDACALEKFRKTKIYILFSFSRAFQWSHFYVLKIIRNASSKLLSPLASYWMSLFWRQENIFPIFMQFWASFVFLIDAV